MSVRRLAIAVACLASTSCLVGRASHLAPRFRTTLQRAAPSPAVELPLTRRADGALVATDEHVELAVRADENAVGLELLNRHATAPLRVDVAGARLVRPDGAEVVPLLTATRQRIEPIGDVPPGTKLAFHACESPSYREAGQRPWCQFLLGGGASWVEGPRGEARVEGEALVGKDVVLVLPVVVGDARLEYRVRLTIEEVTVSRRWMA